MLVILAFITTIATALFFRASLRRQLFLGIELLGLGTLVGYCFTLLIFIIYFIRVFRLWRDNITEWHIKMKLAYLFLLYAVYRQD